MKKRAKSVFLLFGAILTAGALYVVFNAVTGIGIPCIFHAVTGLSCPGCGISRMLISMLRLDFASAFRYNAAIFILSPAFIVLAVQLISKYIKTGSKALSKRQTAAVTALIILLILFAVIRNLPGFEYLR